MSDQNSVGDAGSGGVVPSSEPSTVETVTSEAADLKDTATGAAKDVAGTAKEEAASVAREAKAQASDLFHQARRELNDQASNQQQRLAAGLGTIGDELGAMSRDAGGSGVAADLVRRVSDRASAAASWLGSRDPAGVLDDVKAFARRRPVVFIGAALVAGVVAGRLTRALIAEAKDDSPESATAAPRPSAISSAQEPSVGAAVTPVDDSPVYAESAARLGSGRGETSDERSDSF